MIIYGLVMVYSSSFPYSVLGKDHPFYFIGRQLLWTALGVVGMVIAAIIPYKFWERWSVPLMGLTLMALVVLLLIGIERFGSTRTFFGGSVQPSQPAKVVIIIYIATWLASKLDRIRSVTVSLIPFSMLLGFLSLLIVLQPSISTAVLIVVTASIMFFIAGAAVAQLLVVAAGAGATFYFVLQYSSYASERIEKYWASIRNPLESAEHQVWQSVQALTLGGPYGVGIGQGTAQQFGFVPLAWTDNIFAVIGQELGLLGALLVILLFALLAWRGLRIAMRCRDPFGMLLAVGLTSMLVVQALLNIAVVVAAVPPTGVPLPFFSYGGSSMVTAMTAVGLLFSISRHGRTVTIKPARPAPAIEGGSPRMVPNATLDLGWRDGRPRVSGAGRGSATKPSSRSASTKNRTPAGATRGSAAPRRSAGTRATGERSSRD